MQQYVLKHQRLSKVVLNFSASICYKKTILSRISYMGRACCRPATPAHLVPAHSAAKPYLPHDAANSQWFVQGAQYWAGPFAFLFCSIFSYLPLFLFIFSFFLSKFILFFSKFIFFIISIFTHSFIKSSEFQIFVPMLKNVGNF